MEDLRALGEYEARRGATREAAVLRDRLIGLAEQVKDMQVSNRMQGLIPRGYAGAGSIDLLLGNREGAKKNFEHALAEHRRLQALPGYAGRDDLMEVEAALAKLR